jgi:N-acyl-L-homoserine lactone synthetase
LVVIIHPLVWEWSRFRIPLTPHKIRILFVFVCINEGAQSTLRNLILAVDYDRVVLLSTASAERQRVRSPRTVVFLCTGSTLDVACVTQVRDFVVERLFREAGDEPTTLTKERVQLRDEYWLLFTLDLGRTYSPDQQSSL